MNMNTFGNQENKGIIYNISDHRDIRRNSDSQQISNNPNNPNNPNINMG